MGFLFLFFAFGDTMHFVRIAWAYLQDHGGLISGYSTEENASFSPGTHIPLQWGVGPQETLLPLWDRMLITPVLCRSFVGNHSCCEFPSAAAMSSPEDRMPQSSSLLPGSYMLSVSTSVCSQCLGGCGIDVLFRAKQSTVNLSHHFYQLSLYSYHYQLHTEASWPS